MNFLVIRQQVLHSMYMLPENIKMKKSEHGLMQLQRVMN